MTSRPAAPSRRPSPVAPRGGPALPLASAGRSCHIILLLFSPYLELLSRQFRPRARPPRLSVCGIRRSGALFWVCVCVCVWECVFGGFVGARRGQPGRGEGRKPQSSRVSGCALLLVRSEAAAVAAPSAPRRGRGAGAGNSEDPFAEASSARWS